MATKVHPTTQTGTRGELKAAVIFADIGWAPPVKLSEDIGTDFITFARDTAAPEDKDDAWDLGAPVCLQIKGSPSEYATPDAIHKGESGWWFAESETYHFDHWLSFGLPYLLVLVDVTNQVAYWVEVNGDAIVATGKGRKIFVPANQKVDTDNLDALNRIAVARRKHTLEGAVWNGKLNDLGPADRLRNALVLPRLVAPHPNKSVSKLAFEEAAAMVVRNRYSELRRRGNRGQCPKPEQWKNHKDWGWRFVHALYELVTQGSASKFAQLESEARHRFERDACLVVQGCAEYASGNVAGALAPLLPSRSTKPADRGWLYVHRAAFLLELDKPDEAAEAAKKALVAIKALDGDLSVSVIRGGAAEVLYAVADFGVGDIEATVTAQDNAGTWWRTQDVSWALEKDLKLRFEGWTDNGSIHFLNSSAQADLSVAGWSAAFSGSWGSWRHLATLKAQLTLTSTNDVVLLGAALSDLVLIGEKKIAKDAARKIWMEGPIESLNSLVNTYAYRAWSRRDEGAVMAVFSQAGDLLKSEAADYVVQRIIDLINTDGSVRVRGNAWSFRWNEVDGALRRVLRAASPTSHERVAEFLAAEFATCDESVAIPVVRIANELAVTQLDLTCVNQLLEAATVRGDRYAIHLLEVLAPVIPAAVSELRARAEAGNVNAIRSLLVAGSTDRNDFIIFGRRAARTVRTMVQDVVGEGGTRKMTDHSSDQLDDLTLAALNTNDTKLWKQVTDALEACVIEETQQQRTIRRLGEQFQNLPRHVQRKLRSLVPSIHGTSFGVGFGSSRNEYAASVTQLRIAAGTVPDFEIEALLLAERRSDPVGFVRNLGAWNSARKLPLLATAIVDDNPRVREHAGYNIIKHARTFPDDRDRAFAIIRSAHALENGGALADGIAQGLSVFPDEGLADVEADLRSHPSAVIRGRFLHDH
ncbi:DUF4365 domain-containing protein [Isoptericola sp. NPDC057559]|uniref:DUF4365 domain-containing protein n=1 Tax=Isoptericola sp. NPDC057559 TaxID=3346168 RepID=UPI003675CA36